METLHCTALILDDAPDWSVGYPGRTEIEEIVIEGVDIDLDKPLRGQLPQVLAAIRANGMEDAA